MICLIAEFLVLEFLRTDPSGPKRVGTGDAELEKKPCPHKVTCSHPYKVWVHVFILFLLSFLLTSSILWVLVSM